MGLTIHYGLKSSTRKPKELVEKMRQLALDLPFERVGEKVRYFGPEVCKTNLENLRPVRPENEELFSAILDASKHIRLPWNGNHRISVQPLEIYNFDTVPGPGSEWASFGLARYPAEIEIEYRPSDDKRFITKVTKDGYIRWHFDYHKWEKWLKANGHNPWMSPNDFQEKRKIKTHLTGWQYASFCKTQYATDPQCGGIPNFVRCHLCVIHLLDRIAELPTMKVEVCDEGKYGRSHYTDDPSAKKPVYTWHEGKYDVKALCEEVGAWNQMIAAVFGGLQDAMGGSDVVIEAPITHFANFEQLEFKGQKDVSSFLQAMKQLAEKKEAI